MNQSDRKFVKNLINGLDQKINGLDQKINGLDQRINGLDQKISKKISSLDVKLTDINAKVSSNKEEIIKNGVMIEKLQDLIYSVAENNTGLDRRLCVVENALGLD